MKKLLFLAIPIIFLMTSCKPTLNVLGEKIKASDLCGTCNPGNLGPYMIMTKKVYSPTVEDNSTPIDIAYSVLGHVFPAKVITGQINIPCSSTSTKNPFSINQVKKLGVMDLKYSTKEILELNVATTVESDLTNIKTANPTLPLEVLDTFKAKLTAAYSKFANKEVTINGIYYEFELDKNAIIRIAKNLEYSECRDYIYSVDNPKRLITAIGILYFHLSTNENTIDDIASSLEADAKSYGVIFNIGVEFKRNISRKLEKSTTDSYQIVAWRTVGVSELDMLR